MKTTIGVLLLCLIAIATNAAPAVSGEASCAKYQAGDSACQVSWSWQSNPRAMQWIQTFDPDHGSWVTFAETAATQTGVHTDPVESGKLYRAVSCEDPAVATTCIYSTVVWAPLLQQIDEIPPAVVTERGAILSVSKSTNFAAQASQLNIYHLRMLFESPAVKATQLPPMTLPVRRWDSKEFSAVDNVLNNVFDYYEGSRMPQVSDGDESKAQTETAGSAESEGAAASLVEAEWIGVVPHEKKNDYRSQYLSLGGIEDSMIVFGPPNSKYTVTVFTDLGCEHCQKLMRHMSDINALGIRVRFMAFPLAGPFSDVGIQMKSVWCAVDRKEALKRALLGAASPPSGDCKRETVMYHYALAKKLGLFGAPSMLADNGELIGGYLTPTQLLARLREVEAH